MRAFLNAPLDEYDEIYVAQPDGYEDGTGRVCRLLQALYGLRKAPRLWFETLTKALANIGFEPLSSDLCIFKHRSENILMIVYVDDMLISAPNKAMIASIMRAMETYFELKEMGDVKHFLGINIKRDRTNHRIFLSQESFANKMLQEFVVGSINPI